MSHRVKCETCNASRWATHKARIYNYPESDDCETLQICCDCNNCDDDCDERETVYVGWDSPNGGDGEI